MSLDYTVCILTRLFRWLPSVVVVVVVVAGFLDYWSGLSFGFSKASSSIGWSVRLLLDLGTS